jgi:hypothetical protein
MNSKFRSVLHLRTRDVNMRKHKREQNGRSKVSPSKTTWRSRTWTIISKERLVDQHDYHVVDSSYTTKHDPALWKLQYVFINNDSVPEDICCTNRSIKPMAWTWAENFILLLQDVWTCYFTPVTSCRRCYHRLASLSTSVHYGFTGYLPSSYTWPHLHQTIREVTSPAGTTTVAGVEEAGGGRWCKIRDARELHPLQSCLPCLSFQWRATTTLKWDTKKTLRTSQSIWTWLNHVWFPTHGPHEATWISCIPQIFILPF